VGDRLWTGKPLRRGISHSVLLSLSLPSVQARISTWRKLGGVNRHIAWHTSPCTWSRSVLWCLAGG